MRLIDIDHHFKINEAFYRADIEMPLHRVKIALEYEPTVKAVPIEWMKRYAKKICEDDGGIFNSKAYGINRMIRDWEKENE